MSICMILHVYTLELLVLSSTSDLLSLSPSSSNRRSCGLQLHLHGELRVGVGRLHRGAGRLHRGHRDDRAALPPGRRGRPARPRVSEFRNLEMNVTMPVVDSFMQTMQKNEQTYENTWCSRIVKNVTDTQTILLRSN